MKTAVSIPDPIFARAEQTRQRLCLSRSELYAKAIEAFVSRESEEETTKQLNTVYSGVSSELDPAISAMQFHSIPKEHW